MAASVYVKGGSNIAEISLPAGVELHVKTKTNSSFTQKISVPINGTTHTFSGTGERNTMIGDTRVTLENNKPLLATFEYAKEDGVFKPSSLKNGGPYNIGKYNILVIVAENGDDSDFNDAILEFSWYTPANQQ